jgi:phage terminase small subunit
VEKYELAELDYIGGMKYKDIAKKYEISVNTVKSWKQRYNWTREKRNSRNGEKECAHKNEKVCTQKIKGAAVVKEEPEECENAQQSAGQKNPALDERKKLFCLFYSQTFNATKSYQKAYGCSMNTARAHGYELLQNVDIKNEIEHLAELKRQQLVAKESDLLELQMRIAFADAGDYYEIKDNMVMFRDSEETDTQLVSEVKQSRAGLSVKLCDKQKAMDWLSKYFLVHPDDRYKAEFDRKKAELNENKGEEILANMQTITELLQKPVKNRHIEDFEESENNEHSGTI